MENQLESIINFNTQLQIISVKNTIARGFGFQEHAFSKVSE